MNTERNCQSCKYYKDGYCENLELKPCYPQKGCDEFENIGEMTAEEYRQRMIQAFHNADCDELIALVVLPTEKEFEHLEWLLEKHYKAKPELYTDAEIQKMQEMEQAEIQKAYELGKAEMQKTGRWIMKHRTHNAVKYYTGQDEMGETHTISVLERYEVDEPYCSECGKLAGDTSQNYCCACGAKMQESEDKE